MRPQGTLDQILKATVGSTWREVRQFFGPRPVKFPIKTATSCVHKWSWSTIFLSSGTTTSCHRCDHLPIDASTFDTFHNHPKKLRDRRAMLDGRWPKPLDPNDQNGCGYCEKIERAGGVSDRQIHLDESEITPPELREDKRAIEVTPRILEIYFTNQCNLACLYCSPQFSSRWETENHREVPKEPATGEFTYPQFSISRKTHPDYAKMTAKLYDWLRVHGQELTYLNILGGEPFFQAEFDQLISLIEEVGFPKLTLGPISNLMVPHERFVEQIGRLEKLIEAGRLKAVRITASLDGWGPEVEFVRSGLDLKRWEKNFRHILGREGFRLSVNMAINPLTIKTMPALFAKVMEWRQISYVEVSFMTVVYPIEMNPDIFGPGVFKNDFDRTVEAMPLWSPDDEGKRAHMAGIGRQVESGVRKPTELRRFLNYLEMMDRRRKTNWRVTFPWLADELADVIAESRSLSLTN